MTYSSSGAKAHRREIYHRLVKVVRGSAPERLPSFNDLRTRLHLFEQSYAGLQTIDVANIDSSLFVRRPESR
jgi:hypothetical protein